MLIKRMLLCLVILSLFLGSLTQTAITYKNYSGLHSYSSLEMLLSGPVGWIGGATLELVIWLANPFYFASIFWVYRNENKAAFKTSFIAAILAVIFLSWKEILVSLEPGYYLWLASLLILAGFNFLQLLSAKQS